MGNEEREVENGEMEVGGRNGEWEVGSRERGVEVGRELQRVGIRERED